MQGARSPETVRTRYKGYNVFSRLPRAVSINKKKSAATTAAPAKLWSAHAWATYAGLAISGAVTCCYLRIAATWCCHCAAKQEKARVEVRVWTHFEYYIIHQPRKAPFAPSTPERSGREQPPHWPAVEGHRLMANLGGTICPTGPNGRLPHDADVPRVQSCLGQLQGLQLPAQIVVHRSTLPGTSRPTRNRARSGLRNHRIK